MKSQPDDESEDGTGRSPAVPGWLAPAQVQAYAAEATTAYRVGASADGWVERFGDDYLVCHRTAEARAPLVDGLTAWAEAVGLPVARVFARDLPRQPRDRDLPELLSGNAQASRQTVVTERGMRFTIDFAGGHAVGLFVDQRHNRERVRRLRPARLLNCFAYTCSFGVAAALGGGRTVNIDLSSRVLERGRANFRENGLDPAAHVFLAQDVLAALPELRHRDERFDMVVLDPPTFSTTARGQPFHVDRDLDSLLLTALDLVPGRGHILLSTNSLAVGDRDLECMARRCLHSRRRAAELTRERPLAPLPPSPLARTLWLALR